ncbi:MAG TPA: iron-containing alcohol dehydrogenase [Syntrophobacteraceae bacterium]|nr:iron-containing alcohol dehydrogenase [Syntrophobacteraceae bacterium]
MHVLKFSIPEIIFGRDSVQYVGVCARQLGAEKVFLVSDPGVEKAGWVERVVELLKKEKLRWVYYSNVSTNPRDSQVQEGVSLYREQEADVVIGLGGGSPMDTAKGIALVASNGGQIRDYEGANRISYPLPPMLLIPTTAGSGSDISQFAVIRDVERRVKMSIISRTLLPNISIVDPTLLLTQSEDLIAAAALDALSHAVESYVSRIASPFTESQSLQAIQLIMKFARRAVESRELEYLEQLSIASNAAAMAFSNAGVGAEHALAHALGGMFDVLHGWVHPVLLPAVLRFNSSKCLNKMAVIGDTILGKRYGSHQATCDAAIDKLDEFCASLGGALNLRQIVSDPSLLDDLCRIAAGDVCLLTNPREAGWEDLLGICKEAW